MSRTPEYKAFDSCQIDGSTDSGYEHRTSPGNAINNNYYYDEMIIVHSFNLRNVACCTCN